MTTPTPTDQASPALLLLRRRWLAIAGGIALVAALVGGAMGFSYPFLREPAPAAI